MKKILALLLALCMVFALAACGEPAATESQAPADDAPASEALPMTALLPATRSLR